MVLRIHAGEGGDVQDVAGPAFADVSSKLSAQPEVVFLRRVSTETAKVMSM